MTEEVFRYINEELFIVFFEICVCSSCTVFLHLFVGYLVGKTSFITFTKKRETNIGKRVSTTSQNDKT